MAGGNLILCRQDLYDLVSCVLQAVYVFENFEIYAEEECVLGVFCVISCLCEYSEFTALIMYYSKCSYHWQCYECVDGDYCPCMMSTLSLFTFKRKYG